MNPRRALALGFSVVGLLASSTSAQDSGPTPEQINQAIDRGVAYLRQAQNANGSWTYTQHGLGMTALAGLALLESEVPRDDPAIQSAEELVRRHASQSTQTYDLALAILFLAKLDPDDEETRNQIRRLGWKLAGGCQGGMWDYTVPSRPSFPLRVVERPGPEAVPAASGSVPARTDDPTATGGGATPDAKTGAVVSGRASEGSEEPEPSADASTKTETTAEAETENASAAPKPKPKPKPKPTPRRSTRNNRGAGVSRFPVRPARGDHSNTQFGMLGVWVAGQFGYDSDPILEQVEAHFRAVQRGDGSWGYRPDGGMAFGPQAMTCVGLLGLYLSASREFEGGEQEALDRGRQLENHPAFRKGLEAVTGYARRIDSSSNTYFLWSLERVCVALGKETLNGFDWYQAGARVLVDRQQRDGSWNYGWWGELPDTALALLFLHRSNLATGIERQVRLADYKPIAGLPFRVRPAEPEPAEPATPESPASRPERIVSQPVVPPPPPDEPESTATPVAEVTRTVAPEPVGDESSRPPAEALGLIRELPGNPRAQLSWLVVLIALLAVPAIVSRISA
jgi:hypothetical protein